jgi:hypothetical protein
MIKTPGSDCVLGAKSHDLPGCGWLFSQDGRGIIALEISLEMRQEGFVKKNVRDTLSNMHTVIY